MNQSDGARVLVVEDDADTQRLAGQILEARGYSVRLASNGAVGLEQVLTFRPEVVLFDFWMPVADGRALVQGLREVVRTRVGLVCMSATPEVEDWCARIGVSAFVQKPFAPEPLIDAVHRALEDARASSMRVRAADAEAVSSRPPRSERAVLLVGRGARARDVRGRLRAEGPPVQVAAVDAPDDARRALASIAVDAVAVCDDEAIDDPELEHLVAESAARKLPVVLPERGRADADVGSGAARLVERLRAILTTR